MSIPQTMMDQAAIEPFKNDLNAMTTEQLRKELAEVTETIERETAWQEAIVAFFRLTGVKK